MTEHEMLEAEKYWCENCCNWDKEEVQMDACSTCKLTGTRVFAQESGKKCKCFNVPAENVPVLPYKVGDTVWAIIGDRVRECQIHHYKIFSETQVICFEEKAYRGRHYEWSEGYVGVTLFKTKEEALSKLQASYKQMKGGEG